MNNFLSFFCHLIFDHVVFCTLLEPNSCCILSECSQLSQQKSDASKNVNEFCTEENAQNNENCQNLYDTNHNNDNVIYESDEVVRGETDKEHDFNIIR